MEVTRDADPPSHPENPANAETRPTPPLSPHPKRHPRRSENSRPLPFLFDDLKIVICPNNGLRIGEWPKHSVASAVGIRAGLPINEANKLFPSIHSEQNIATVSTHDETLAM